MNERDSLYVAHLTEAIERIRRFTKTGRAAFMADDMIQSAVVRQIEKSNASSVKRNACRR